MSEELEDEVKAINSIFGDSTLTPYPGGSGQEFILQLPQNASSIRIHFPPSYPSVPPTVLGTHSSSKGIRGAGARDVRLFRGALEAVFQEGTVCLFDALGDWERLYEDVAAQQEEEDEEDKGDETAANQDKEGYGKKGKEEEGEGPVQGGGNGCKSGIVPESMPMPMPMPPPPPWALSEPVVDMKSTFLAHVAPVSSPEQANAYLAHLLASDKRIRSATHNITAWRIQGADGKSSYQDCDDDGETAAGGRILHLMQLMDVWNAMVVVTRWYGGVHLGPRRFAIINAVARDGFVRAGMVKDNKGGKKSK